MSNINKVPASAGAEWLLGGFALLRKAPLALGLLGVIWGLLSMVVVQLMAFNVTAGLILQLGLAVLGPLLFAGLLSAVHEVEQGRPAQPAHLFQFIRSERSGSLLATLLPQLGATLVLGLLLFVMIGPSQLQHLGEVMVKLQEIAQAGGQPDPELVQSLPVGRLFLWMLLLFAAVIAISLFTFVAVPDVVFGGRDGIAAMRNSFRACLHNLLALVVFFLLLMVAMFAILFAIGLLSLVAQLIAGPVAASWVSNLLLMAVLMPLLAGAVYHAWKQMLGGVAAAQSVPSHLEA